MTDEGGDNVPQEVFFFLVKRTHLDQGRISDCELTYSGQAPILRTKHKVCSVLRTQGTRNILSLDPIQTNYRLPDDFVFLSFRWSTH